MRSISGEALQNVTSCPKCHSCILHDQGSPVAYCQDCNREFNLKKKKVVTSFKH
jgi:ribosomal protein L37AE/L43A